jgi:DNA-binding FadR family transcriptional regulator
MRAADFADRPTHELALRPIRRPKVSDEAALRLESMIRDGAFPEGALLPPERELMKMFGVGRASIREALYGLGRMGLVRVRNGERPLVTRPTPENLIAELSGVARHFLAGSGGPEHFQAARALFEVGVARLAAMRASAGDIEQLRRSLEANSAARGDIARFERTDVAFHHVLARITQNPIFVAVHDALVEWLTSQRTISLRAPGAEQAAFESHRRIFEAVSAKDGEAAAAAMDDHLKSVTDLIRIATEAESETARRSR